MGALRQEVQNLDTEYSHIQDAWTRWEVDYTSLASRLAHLRGVERSSREVQAELLPAIADVNDRRAVLLRQHELLHERLAAVMAEHLVLALEVLAVRQSPLLAELHGSTRFRLARILSERLSFPVDGRVVANLAATPDPHVVVSVGVSAGVRTGDMFTVVRGEQFIARISAVRVEEGSTLCTVLFTAPGVGVREGDQVTTQLPL